MNFKGTFFWVLLFFLMGCSISEEDDFGHNPELESAAAKAMVANNNTFAMDFFKEISNGEELENYMVSPLSLSMALGMTYNGAEGQTETAFGDVLGYEDVDGANKFNQKLIKSLMVAGNGATLNLANAIWIRDDFPVETDFVAINQKYYYAEVDNLDFNDSKALEVVNTWAYDQTKGKIDKFIDQFDSSTVLFLANALYFKGTWKFEFKPSETKEAAFHTSNSTVQVPMMSMNATVPYFANDTFSSIILPYKNDRFQMVVFLPHEDYTTSEIVANFSMESLGNWLKQYAERGLDIKLPKFKYEYKNELNNELATLGLGIAFSNNADFGKINKEASLRISRVLQKTFIEVNEEGTEAAAVTSVEIVMTSAGPSFVANHPFIYMIRDSYTGTICFMGRVGRP